MKAPIPANTYAGTLPDFNRLTHEHKNKHGHKHNVKSEIN